MCVQVIWLGIYTSYLHKMANINQSWVVVSRKKKHFDNSRTPYNVMNWWHTYKFYVWYEYSVFFSVIIAWIFDFISAYIQLMARRVIPTSDYLMLVWVRTRYILGIQIVNEVENVMISIPIPRPMRRVKSNLPYKY